MIIIQTSVRTSASCSLQALADHRTMLTALLPAQWCLSFWFFWFYSFKCLSIKHTVWRRTPDILLVFCCHCTFVFLLLLGKFVYCTLLLNTTHLLFVGHTVYFLCFLFCSSTLPTPWFEMLFSNRNTFIEIIVIFKKFHHW